MSRLAGLAQRHWQIFRFFQGVGNEHARTFDRFYSFVEIEKFSHRSLSILHLSSFFGGQDSGDGLRKVLATVAGEGRGPELIVEIEAWLERRSKLVQRVKNIRHQAIAHRAIGLTHDEVYLRQPIIIGDYEELVGEAVEHATALASIYRGVDPPSVTGAVALDDLDRLFQAAKRDNPLAFLDKE